MAKNFARVYAAQPYGLSGNMVSVEVDVTHGLHAFSIVGLPDTSVSEAKDRVASAIKNCGFISPKQDNHKTIVSLAPAELRKEGSYFDVAIAMGYLLATHAIEFDPERKLFIGELSLNGEVRPLNGILSIAQKAKQSGFMEIFVPRGNADEASLITDLQVYGVEHLRDVIAHLDSENEFIISPHPTQEIGEHSVLEFDTNFSNIKGQEFAKRGLEIAAAGGHNVLMSGPPGTGKTMLARAFAGILPHLHHDEILQVTGIHSIAGILKDPFITHPPFRSPHHTASYTALVGGGSFPKPGEITLAHRGVLFMDEFPEFDKRVIEALRQPMEDRVIHIARARGTVVFPAQFILVAAMNPCPCGNLGALYKKCICSPADISRYAKKISGPILDRIEIHVTVEHVDYEKLGNTDYTSESSEVIQKRIHRAREIQAKRFGNFLQLNAHMKAKDIEQLVITNEVKKVLRDGASALSLSPRSFHRIIKLARTIADLEGIEHIEPRHVFEAFGYRGRNE